MEEAGPRRGSAVVVLILVVMALISLQGLSSLVSDSAESETGEAQGAEPEEPEEPGALLPTISLMPSPEPEPSAEPEQEPEDEVDVASLRFKRFAHPYPKGCLRPVDRPEVGMLAAFQGGNVSIVAPGSRSVVRIPTKKPIAWSPSGKYLATGRGDLFRPSGRRAGSLLGGGASLWAWSTTTDCAIAVDRAGLVVDGPDLDVRALLGLPGVEELSFSPDGRRLGFVLRESDGRSARSIWIADLERGSARRVERFSRRTPVVKLLGWNFASTHLYFGASVGESVSADGVVLRFVAARGGRQGRGGATLLAEDSFLTHCGGRDLVVAGAGRDTNLNKRLAYLTPSGPSYITPTSAAVLSPSCSHDGGYIAAIAAGEGDNISTRRLAVFRSDGVFERFLAPDGSGDEYPVWGPQGTGVAFIRMRPSRKLADVWFIAEGATARPTPLAVAVPPNDHGRYDWAEVFDWSAAP
jgi:hypothetical protein